jgi:hypothetical protein
MIKASEIKHNTQVVGSNNELVGVVDRIDGGDTIKLAKDSNGQHHYIPLSWVTSVDDKLHVDRPSDQAMREWATAPKAKVHSRLN